MTMVVGYRLTDISNQGIVREWGGIWGQCPGLPNPIVLPGGDRVHAPSLNEDYGGYILTEWEMEEPAPTVPESVDAAQVRLVLLQQGLLDQVETMIAAQGKAAQIEWEFRVRYHRDNPLLLTLASQLKLTDEQLDQLFIQASQL